MYGAGRPPTRADDAGAGASANETPSAARRRRRRESTSSRYRYPWDEEFYQWYDRDVFAKTAADIFSMTRDNRYMRLYDTDAVAAMLRSGFSMPALFRTVVDDDGDAAEAEAELHPGESEKDRERREAEERRRAGLRRGNDVLADGVDDYRRRSEASERAHQLDRRWVSTYITSQSNVLLLKFVTDVANFHVPEFVIDYEIHKIVSRAYVPREQLERLRVYSLNRMFVQRGNLQQQHTTQCEDYDVDGNTRADERERVRLARNRREGRNTTVAEAQHWYRKHWSGPLTKSSRGRQYYVHHNCTNLVRVCDYVVDESPSAPWERATSPERVPVGPVG